MRNDAERRAVLHYVLRGYRILARNFRYSRLEIDLVARRDRELAVVEVKYRRGAAMGGALAAVSPAKQRDLETAAVGFLRLRRLEGVGVRFDVVTIDPDPGDPHALRVRHHRGAFAASGRYRL